MRTHHAWFSSVWGFKCSFSWENLWPGYLRVPGGIFRSLDLFALSVFEARWQSKDCWSTWIRPRSGMCLLFGYFVERGGGCPESSAECCGYQASPFLVILLKSRRKSWELQRSVVVIRRLQLFGCFCWKGRRMSWDLQRSVVVSGVSSFSVILLKGRRSPESFSWVLLLSGAFSLFRLGGKGGGGSVFNFLSS